MTEPVLHIDFETRSVVDLKKAGLHVYSLHETTSVWCMAWAVDDEPVQTWRYTDEGDGNVQRALNWVQNEGRVVGHNVRFEHKIWNDIMVPRFGWPKLDIRQTDCTMARAYAMALPGDLARAAAAAGLNIRKDASGHRLMMQMAKPRKKPDPDCKDCDGTGVFYGNVTTCHCVTWWDDEERFERLVAYCEQDVEVERALEKRLRPLSNRERAMWLLDYTINERGVMIDHEAVAGAERLVQKIQQQINVEMHAVTDGVVGRYTNVNELTKFVRDAGFDTPGIAKADIADLLIRDDLPDNVRRALELRQTGARTSTAKLSAMRVGANEDGRVRGTMQYHAATTGRWGGRRIQPQNLPRPKLSQAEIETAIELMASGDEEMIELLHDDPMSVVSDCLRGMIIPHHKRDFICPDFSNVEGRGLAWLAGDRSKLKRFEAADRGDGPDIYIVTAAGIYNVKLTEVAKDQRQVGKVSELALGYGGGVGAFAKMAKGYGVDMRTAFDPVWETATDTNRELAKDAWEQRGKGMGLSARAWVASELIKLAWREKHPRITKFWALLEGAAINAVTTPGRETRAGKHIKFRMGGSFLFCRLPSSRLLTYPYPEIRDADTPWGSKKEAVWYKGLDSYTNQWTDISTYGGKLAENVTQAISRDLLRDALFRLHKAKYPVVLHVHDEALVEVRRGRAELADVERIMEVVPKWATGFPIKAEGWRGERYRK